MQTRHSQTNTHKLTANGSEDSEKDPQNQAHNQENENKNANENKNENENLAKKTDSLNLEKLKEKVSHILTPSVDNNGEEIADKKTQTSEKTDDKVKADGLKSQKKYLCANHSDRKAFALCANCGKYLCADCGLVINARNYCEHCTLESPEVGHEIEARVSLIAETNPQILDPIPKAPKRIADLPSAVRRMFTQGPSFFLSVAKTPFWLSFIVAFLAKAPSTLIAVLNFPKDPPPIKAELTPYLENLQNLSTTSLIGLALLTTFIQILLLDLAYFLSIRGFTKSEASFKESSSVLHFCLVPLILTAVASLTGFQFIAFLGLGIMIIQCSTATRIFTRAGFWQGLLAMLSFIFLVSWSGLLA